MTSRAEHAGPQSLPECRTGIRGLNEIAAGGLPRGRPILVCGAAGCAKTLLPMEVLLRGILDHGEAGEFTAFKETAVINGEQGERALTRHGLVEYGSDCSVLAPIANSEQVLAGLGLEKTHKARPAEET